MASANLCLHTGAREVTRVELDAVPCPPYDPSSRWRPVPHGVVLNHALMALTHAGYEVQKMQLGLSRGDQRFFGTLTLQSALASGVHLAVGVRSSTDRSIALQWCAGSRVFVCDNLAFQSQKVISRKHTVHGVTRYQEAITRAVSGLAEYRDTERVRIRKMQEVEIDDTVAESLLLKLYQDEKILSPSLLPSALAEWRSPRFEEFSEVKNVWRLFNAVTWSLQGRAKSNPQGHAAATVRLSALLSPSVSAEEVHLAASA